MDDMNILRVPRAHDGLEPLVLDMTAIRQAEGRLQEVALTNSIRAPELLALFNGAFLNASRYINFLEYELDVAERRLTEFRAVFLIDKLPTLLAEKGLATARSPLGSEDIRQAFLDREPEYRRILDLIGNLRCYLGLLETQQKGFENAYNSVKKLIGQDTTPSWRPNPNLPQPLTTPAPSEFKVTSAPASTKDDDFFGSPK